MSMGGGWETGHNCPPGTTILIPDRSGSFNEEVLGLEAADQPPWWRRVTRPAVGNRAPRHQAVIINIHQSQYPTRAVGFAATACVDEGEMASPVGGHPRHPTSPTPARHSFGPQHAKRGKHHVSQAGPWYDGSEKWPGFGRSTSDDSVIAPAGLHWTGSSPRG